MVVIVDAAVASCTILLCFCLSPQSTDYGALGKKRGRCGYLSSSTQYTCTESLLYAKYCMRYRRYKDEKDLKESSAKGVPDLKEPRALNCGLLQYNLVSAIY